MSGITLTEVANSTIPTPASGKATLFQSTDEEAPAYKDDAGTVHTLKGDDGDPAPALTYQDHSNTGATETVDASNADVHRLVADAATVTLTLTGWAASGTPHAIRLWLEQDGTGGRVWVFPAAVTWGEPGEPDWTTRAAGDIDIVDLFTVDGGTTVLAGLFGREGPAGANTAAADVTADTTGYGNSSASDVQAVLDDFDSAITAAAGGTGYSEGSSFPGSPSSGDKFYRTDRNLLYYYDGTRWLTVQLFTAHGNFSAGLSATTEIAHIGLFEPTYDVYFVALRGMTFVSTTNNGTSFWTVNVKKVSDSSVIGSFNTSADTANTLTSHVANIGATSTEKAVYIDVVKTSAPGNVSPYITLTYRLVG